MKCQSKYHIICLNTNLLDNDIWQVVLHLWLLEEATTFVDI